jgi:hypothetical protein
VDCKCDAMVAVGRQRTVGSTLYGVSKPQDAVSILGVSRIAAKNDELGQKKTLVDAGSPSEAITRVDSATLMAIEFGNRFSASPSERPGLFLNLIPGKIFSRDHTSPTRFLVFRIYIKVWDDRLSSNTVRHLTIRNIQRCI